MDVPSARTIKAWAKVVKATDHTKPTIKTTTPTVCHECGGYFTPAGLAMHTGSNKCEINKRARPLAELVKKNRDTLKHKDKEPIVTNIAQAIRRRGLMDLTGLESAKTKLVKTDLECYVKEEFWVYSWVKMLWKKYSDEGYTRKFYMRMENLLSMPLNDRESEIGLILLGVSNDDD